MVKREGTHQFEAIPPDPRMAQRWYIGAVISALVGLLSCALLPAAWAGLTEAWRQFMETDASRYGRGRGAGGAALLAFLFTAMGPLLAIGWVAITAIATLGFSMAAREAANGKSIEQQRRDFEASKLRDQRAR